MEQYMSKTRADYGSGISMPKIDDKDNFEIKDQFLNKHCPPARTAKKIEEINNFQQEPDETLYQGWERFKELLMKCPQHYLTDVQTRQILDSKGAIPSKTTADAKVAIQEMAKYSQKWHNGTSRTSSTKTSDGLAAIQAQLNNLGREIKKVNEKVYVAQVGCEQCKGSHYTKDCPLKEKGKILEEAYYTQFGGPYQGGGYRAAAPGFYQRNNTNLSYQERRQSMEETLSKFMSESAKRHEENSNMIKEIRASTDAAIRNQGASIKTLKEKDPRSFTLPCYINNVCFDNALAGLGSSISVIPLSTYLNLGLGELAHTKLTVELADRTVKYPKGIAKNVLVGCQSALDPRKTILSTAYAKIDVFKRKITLRVRDEKIIFKNVKPASSLIKRVYMLSLIERMKLDLEARLMGETLVLNRSLGPLYRDYIELNDLNVPLEHRRDQVDDLMPTIKEGKVIDEPMIDIIKTRNNESFDEYPSFCDFDQKIHIDCAYNLRFSYMIGFEHVSANFFPILSVNMMSRKFYNSIIKDKVELKGKNVVGAFMNILIFVGNFSVVTHFVVVENMDGYQDQDMGDIILGEPFCKASCVEAKRFDGLITIHNDSDNVTYQMARSHPRFKHISNAQCNKIKRLLKVSLHDKLNEISHPYQKLKSFYKGVLNLGPASVRDAKMEEWLI
ncbi:putative reverse transcriptase domain-containing protein [Tanacetum coccineum]|uniref:Reverse transcriptase domain-containing protein n=1 Tax=Tanacetum coccineum TaxID=301880 RepID=A0ABQ5APA3_9ASTR